MDHYKLSNCEKVRVIEQKLKKEIGELKNEIEESEMLYGKNVRAISSIPSPMTPIYFQKERKMNIKRALDVGGVQPLKSQGLVMIEELEATLNSDVTEQGLPLLLHQFYLDRMQALVHCKHLHMLRWRRFCEHTDAIERMYPKYIRRLAEIKADYDDAKHRAYRLSAAYHSHILGQNDAVKSLKSEDMAIFFRWLVVHLRSTKKVFSFVKLLEWLPTIHKNDIDLQLAAPVKSNMELDVMNQAATDNKAAWRNMTAGLDFSFLSASSTSLKSSSGVGGSSMTITSDLAFSGLVSNEVTMGIPCHMTELSNFRDQLESLTTEYGIAIRSELVTSADEMELFGAVNRHFKNLFNRQLDCNKFYQYDNTVEGYEHWGADSASHCLKKPSNWVKFVRIKPRNDATQLRQTTYLKQSKRPDELLRSQNMFLRVDDFARVTEALKEHAVAVREPPTVRAIATTTHTRGTQKTDTLWRTIYEGAEKYVNNSSSDASDTSKDSNAASDRSRFGGHSRKKDSYDYANTMQMLGLDEGDDSANQDPTVIQGAYLSFLHLRHLKIRDLRRQCLGILNYFRSIERTITIYDGGLSHESDQNPEEDTGGGGQDSNTSQKKKASLSKTTDHRSQTSNNSKTNNSQGGRGNPYGIGSHQYVHNTPADYKIDQDEFMEFAGVENHDDFYSLDLDEHEHLGGAKSHTGGDGGGDWKSCITAAVVSSGALGADSTPHVQDHRGYYIMYDCAISDFQALDDELVLMASQFIERDTATRAVLRRSQAEKTQQRLEVPGEVDISSYGHRDVDRFAVLLDMWTCELNFLVNKRKLLDCYIEAYHTTFDPTERHNIAQMITDVIHQRPRYDFTQEYFIRTYRAECACLRLKTSLLSQILTNHMDNNKHYLNRVARPVHIPGMPISSSARQEISVNLSRPSLQHVDMLEFHPLLGVVANRVIEALGLAVHELKNIHRPSSTSECIALEKQVLEHAQREWEGLASIGSSFAPQAQKDVFAGDFVEDVYLMNDVIESILNPINEAGEETQLDEASSIKLWKSAVEAVLLRSRLIEASWETEILSRLYKQLATEMGYGEFHMYLRVLQFEFAAKKERVDPPPSMLGIFVVDDNNADRYVPPTLQLAVQELDENHLPKFSFSSREGVVQLLKREGSLENLRLSVTCQVTHKNVLTVAVTQSTNCALWREVKVPSGDNLKEGGVDTSESRSNISVATTVTQGTVRSGMTSPGGRRIPRAQTYSGKLKFGFDKIKRSPEPFISVQLDKVGPRDVVVNAYIHKKETQGMKLRSETETEKLKRSLVADFCREVAFRTSLHAMRSQIIACYSSILAALEPFPSMREHNFMIGRPSEKKRKLDDVGGMIPDPKSFQKRPRRVLSPDGKCFMNLWFIPHFTEVLASHRNMDYESQDSFLRNWLRIASSLHDIILHLCARARLGSAPELYKLGQIGYTAAAEWGGGEGIGAQLSEIQEQINALDVGPSPYTQDPAKVAEFLELRKEVFFVEFEAAVRFAIREAFMAVNNVTAYQTITDNMEFGLARFSNALEPALTRPQIRVPEPLVPGAGDAVLSYPWLSFLASHGRHPTAYSEQWRDPESCMQLCLAGLKDLERQLANGELLGVSLLLQEVLNNGTIAYQALDGNSEELPSGFLNLHQVGKNAPQTVQETPNDEHRLINIKRKSDFDGLPNAARKELKRRKEPKVDPKLPLDRCAYPIDAHRLMRTFLRLWKQLERFKSNWVKERLHVKNIDTPKLVREGNHAFRAEIMVSVYSTMARQMGNGDAYGEIATDDLPLPPPPDAPELSVRARLLIKLLEVYEVKMVTETRQRISKEYTMVLAERSREETALPADLWSQHQLTSNSTSSSGAMRENFTVSRPHFVEDFTRRLMSDGSDAKDGEITFKKEHLNNCLSRLATDVMQRERENYESYTTYYENLLRHHHHLLYVKELELQALTSQKSPAQDGDSAVEAQFQLADRSHELILEITALRAKVTEMREQSMTMDQDIRDDVRRDYQELVQNLFEVCFQMKSRLSLCHLNIHEDVRNLISETRVEAMKSLGKLKNNTPTSTAEERLRTIHAKEEQVKQLQEEQCDLNKLLTKLHALHHWKRSTTGGRYKVTVQKLNQELNKTRRDCLSKTLVAKEEAELRLEELKSARRSLEGSDAKLKNTYEQIERDRKLQKEKEHRDLQEKRNRQQLAKAKQRDMERLMVELEEKDKRLRNVTADVDRHSRIEQSNHSKTQRDLKHMTTQLSIERTLKLDAFDRVDNLQAQVMENDRSVGAMVLSRPTSASLSIAKSGVTQRSRTRSTFITSPTPSTPKIRVRPMSCVPATHSRASDVLLPKKRPQTAVGRLKNKIAAAILTEIYPPTDEHETIIHLDRLAE